MSEATERERRRPSRRRVVAIALAALLAIATIAVVSDLTGGKVTNGTIPPTSVLVGKRVSSFTLPGLNGGVERSPWSNGKPSVLIFFASWCTPCKGEMPRVAAYLQAHDPSPVEVLGMDANDERGAARAFVKRDGVKFPVAFDAYGDVTTGVFGFAALPESVFINAKGVVMRVNIGAISKTQLASGIRSLRSA